MKYQFSFFIKTHYFTTIDADSRLEAVKKFREKYDDARILSITEESK